MRALKEVVAGILQVDASEITDTSSPATIGTWDSFNGLMLVSELEGVYNIKFTMEEVVAVKSVADIKEALKRHGVKDFE